MSEDTFRNRRTPFNPLGIDLADERRERCGCVPLEYGDGPDNTACRKHGNYGPGDARRERYAAAMWPYVAGKSAHVDEAADAAMAVADEEMRVARMETAQLVASQYASENARLRERIEWLGKANGAFVDEDTRLRAELDRRITPSQLSRLRAELSDSRRVAEFYMQENGKNLATISRVRSVADAIDAEMTTEPDTQRAAMQMEAVTRFRAALKEEQ